MPEVPAYEVDTYRNDPFEATQFLASKLRQGSLVLAIGAGISKNMGLPEWKTLVEKCLKMTNKIIGTSFPEIIPGETDNKSLCLKMEDVEQAISGKLNMGRSKEYRDIVRDCLYEDVGSTYGKEILKSELLISIGSLLMGSKRGNIREVFNFNFDDLLEWYLRLHGFDTEIVTTLPTLRRNSDVTIFHPHGFLPLESGPEDSSDFLVFSQHSYDEKLGDSKEPWLIQWKAMLISRVVLFIGMSDDDQTHGPTLTEVHKVLGRSRYTGFWMFGPNVSDKTIRNLTNRNVVPLPFKSFNDYPDFLLGICREALIMERSEKAILG